MSRAATAWDAPPILEPTSEIEAAVRAYRSAIVAVAEADRDFGLYSSEYNHAQDSLIDARQALEAELPTGAWFPVDWALWGWGKRSRRGGLEVVCSPRSSPWPRGE
jgi:hypothetical protein